MTKHDKSSPVVSDLRCLSVFSYLLKKKGKIEQYKFIGVLATTTILPMTS